MQMHPVQLDRLHAYWTEFANDEEKQRLRTLEERIERKKRLLADVYEEKHKIMMRCVRRKRRAEGKS